MSFTSKGVIPEDDNGKPVLGLWDDATSTAIPVHIKSKVTGADGKTYAILDIGFSSAALSAGLLVDGSPDNGVTLKPLKTTSDGTQVANATLQAGVALAGGMMSYREMVSLGLVGSVKVLTGSQALVNNGGGAAAAITLTDQNGVAYTTVTNGKTLYIAYVDVTLDAGGTTAAPLTQTATLTISDGTNNKYKCVAVTGGPGRDLALMPTVASTLTLTVKVSPSNLATAVGNAVVTLLCWEA